MNTDTQWALALSMHDQGWAHIRDFIKKCPAWYRKRALEVIHRIADSGDELERLAGALARVGLERLMIEVEEEESAEHERRISGGEESPDEK